MILLADRQGLINSFAHCENYLQYSMILLADREGLINSQLIVKIISSIQRFC